MKRFLGICMAALLLAGCVVQGNSAAADGPYWEENKFDVEIYTGEFDGTYVELHLGNQTGEYGIEQAMERATGDMAYLLAVDGGFVPMPDIYTKGDIPYAPLESLALMGITAEYGIRGDMRLDRYYVLLRRGEDTLRLTDFYHVERDGRKLETEFCLWDDRYGEVYFPICFVAEQFGGTARFVKDFKKEICGDEKEYGLRVGMIVVEMPKEGQAALTPEEGLAEAQKASQEEFNRMEEIKKKTGKVFWRYDPMAVHYTGEDLGRYYVYELERFEDLPILVNRYTGEIYGVQPEWQGILLIEKRFPSIRRVLS